MDEHGQSNLLCGLLGNKWISMVRVQVREAGVKEKMKPFFFFLIFCFTDLTLASIIFQKLTRGTVALDMIQWQDANAKGREAEVLLLDAMSSEESSYEDDGDGQPKVVGYKVKRLPWESRSLRKTKKNLDKAYQKSLTKRAKERTLPRTVSSDLSEREPPLGLPDWAVENCN